MNYQNAARVALKNFCNKDQAAVNKNLPELMAIQKQNIGEKRIDDQNPHWI